MIRSFLPQPILAASFAALLFCATLASPVAAKEPITPIPARVEYILAKARLGRTLFSDPVLSLDRTIACASCHDLASSGCDNQTVSTGVKGRQGVMNAPTVFNAVFNFRQCWNGRKRDLREQANDPLLNPVEMGMSKSEVERRLNADVTYQQSFREIYGKKLVEYDDVLDAIAEFGKTLITPNSRFDRYLRGEIALTAEEKKGFLNFKKLGCITCHNGVNIGGNSFQKEGLLNPFPWDGKDSDRFEVTGHDFDKNVFKVPTLRNIEITAPYLHDGSIKTLSESINAIATRNLGVKLTWEEERTLIAFLKTLTGQLPEVLADDRERPTATPTPSAKVN